MAERARRKERDRLKISPRRNDVATMVKSEVLLEERATGLDIVRCQIVSERLVSCALFTSAACTSNGNRSVILTSCFSFFIVAVDHYDATMLIEQGQPFPYPRTSIHRSAADYRDNHCDGILG
jgi:hypothetical protein